MMPVIRINDATFADLKSIAIWFGTKTPSETIDRVVRESMERLGIERDEEPDETTATLSNGVMRFDNPPGLTHTKPLTASINGVAIPNPSWAAILTTMIEQVKTKGLDGEGLVRELAVPAKTGRYEKEGFKYHPRLGISVQGQSASDAWKEVDRLANKWRISALVKFCWRQNPKAQYPGKTGELRTGTA